MQNARVKSVAHLKTLEIENSLEEIMQLETEFGNNEVACKIIMKSIWLTHAISELDPSTDTIKIEVLQNSPHLRISSRGLAGETFVEYDGGDISGTGNEDADALESFVCDFEEDLCYQLSLLHNPPIHTHTRAC
ncbi:hypothetical protein HDU98_005906 [Podochytrium sp. JEL0797]|nr:hypothetical protein HDU98_005906 [Podochytrium sp. JEL0797]